MGAPPPPPPNFPQPPKQQDHPNLYLGVDGHLQSPRNNERECPHDDLNFEFKFLFFVPNYCDGNSPYFLYDVDLTSFKKKNFVF
jgi:hypothetical protein